MRVLIKCKLKLIDTIEIIVKISMPLRPQGNSTMIRSPMLWQSTKLIVFKMSLDKAITS